MNNYVIYCESRGWISQSIYSMLFTKNPNMIEYFDTVESAMDRIKNMEVIFKRSESKPELVIQQIRYQDVVYVN